MKKWLAGILACLMLLSASTVSCANNTENPQSTDIAATGAETEAETTFFPAVDKKDYEGAEFRMIGFQEPGSWYYAESLFDTSSSGNAGSLQILNDVIYEMNTRIEEHLGVNMAYTQVTDVRTGGELFDTVRPTIQSGDDVYQLCLLHPYYSYNSFISSGYAMDFYELNGTIDLDQSYWNREVMESLEINDHAYIGLGDLCSYTINMLYANKDLLTDAGREMPYAKVRNGEWTLDEFTTLCAGLYVDDGDGLRNNKDTYGFACMWDANGSTFMQASDIYVATRNEDGFELTIYSDRLIDMYDKLYTWSEDESTYLWDYANSYNPDKMLDFHENRSYITLNSLGTPFLDCDFEVGILPMPKYDKAQKEYAHCNWGNNMILPTTIENKQMVGEVLELMSFYSSTLVQETYFDNVLQLRASESPDDRDMVVLIYNTVVFDPGIAYCDGYSQLYNLVYLPCFGIREGRESVASYYETNKKGAEAALKKIMKVRPRK